MNTTAQATPIQTAARVIARNATMRCEMLGESRNVALHHAAESIQEEFVSLSKRTGWWAEELSTETIEQWKLFNSVAEDILDGTVSRPSTGNVRNYALNAMA